MELGAFSISLAVKNIEASRAFYEKFGFEVEGRLRRAVYRDREYHDNLVMALLL